MLTPSRDDDGGMTVTLRHDRMRQTLPSCASAHTMTYPVSLQGRDYEPVVKQVARSALNPSRLN